MTRLWLTLLLIVWAGAASADPGTLVVALLGGTAALGTVGAAVVQIAVGLAASAIAQKIRARKEAQNRTGIRTAVTTAGGTTPQTLMLGTWVTGGNVVSPHYAHGTTGDIRNALRTMIIDLSDVPIEGVTAIWLNDQRFEIATDFAGTAHATYGLAVTPGGAVGKYAGKVWLKLYDGRQTAADPYLIAKYGAHPERPWTANAIGTGVAYAILTLKINDELWRGEPQVRFEVRGARVYDWRKDTTAGGSGPQREANSATWTWTDNPIVLTRAVLRGIPLPDGTVWGLGVAPSDLPADWWTPAADRADEDVDGQRRYRAGAEVRMATAEQGGDTPFDILDNLLLAASAEVSDIGGTWIVHSAEADLPIATITDDDILVDHTDEFDPFPPLTDRYNAVRSTYVSPEAGWEGKEAPPRYDTAAAAREGRVILADLDLPAVFVDRQAQQLMAAWLAEAQRWRRHVLTLPPALDRLLPFDSITWTSTRNGYVAKVFRIVSRSVDPLTLNVTLGLREADPADYGWTPGMALPSPPASVAVVDPAPQDVLGWAVAAVTITDTAGARARPGIRLSWTPNLTGVTSVQYQIRLASSGATVTTGASADIAEGSTVTGDGLIGDTAYQVRGRLVIPGRATEWTDWTGVTTDPVFIGPDDLDPDLADDLAALHTWIDGGVTDLPAALTAQAQAVTEETVARIEAAQSLAERWRGQVDTARALAAEVAELAAADHAAREQIRQSLSATLGDMRATYDLAITALASADVAAVTRIETLEAESDDLAALVATTQQALVDGDNALALLIATLSVGSAVQFDHSSIWYFDSSVVGWSGPTAPTVTSGWLRPAASTYAVSPGALAVDAGAYSQVRLRARKVGSPTWTGYLWWNAPGDSWNSSRRVTIAEPTWDSGIAILTITPSWTGTIDQIRLELTSTSDASNYIELDWVAIGRPAPGASSADLVAERQARIDGDGALASDLTALSSRVEDAEDGLDAAAGAISALDTRVDNTEAGIVAHSGRLDTLETSVSDPVSGLDALATAIDAVETLVQAGEAGTQAQSAAIRTLRSALRQVAAEGIEAGAQGAATDLAVRNFLAEATQTLDTRVTLTADQVAIIAQAVTLLQAAIPGLATATALQALMTTVTDQGGVITSQGSAITALESAVNDPVTGLATKLATSVIVDYATKTYADGAASGAASSATTALKSDMEGTGGSVKAAQDAADAAAALAGGKGKVIVQSAAPDVADRLAQNLWIDTSGGANTPKRWNGSAWVAVTDKVATDAAAAATTALARRPGVQNLVTRAMWGANALSAVGWGAAGWGLRMVGTGALLTRGATLPVPLRQNTAYSLRFRAKLTAGSSQALTIDLYPDTLPETTRTITAADQVFVWEGITSAHVDMTGTPQLRFFASPLPVGVTVEITDILLVESDVAPTGWTPAPDDIAAADSANATAINTLSTSVGTQGSTLTSIAAALLKLGATVGPSTAETILRMTAEATPAGALARIGLKAAATGTEGDARTAALFLDALAGDQSRVVVQGDAFHVLIGTDTKPMFSVSGGVITLGADIKISGMAAFSGPLQSSNFVAGVAGWRITSAGAAEFNSLIDRSALTTGAVSDNWRADADGPFSNVANTPLYTSVMATLDLGAIVRGTLIQVALSFEGRRGEQAADVSFSFDKRTKEFGGAWSAWEVIKSGDVNYNGSATTWCNHTFVHTIAGRFDDYELRVTYSAGGFSTNTTMQVARNVTIIAQAVMR